MLTWISANKGTIIIGIILGLIVISNIVSIIKNKKKGKPTCGGSCGQCPMGSYCHKE